MTARLIFRSNFPHDGGQNPLPALSAHIQGKDVKMTTAARRVQEPEELDVLAQARESTAKLNWLRQMRGDYAFMFHAGTRIMENMRQQTSYDENADNILNSVVELAGQKIEMLDKAIDKQAQRHDKLMRQLEDYS